jgi:hypothetical protein
MSDCAGETDYHGVLIYDGECPFCSAAATALRRVEAVGAIEWADDPARAFLEAQFGETPFALVFADRGEERVYVGREAARELCDRAGMPVLVQDIVGDNYESLADAIRTVTGMEGEHDPYHGEYPMAEGAKAVFGDLAENAWHTAKVSR